MTVQIALIGDYTKDVLAHLAIPKAIELAAEVLSCQFDYRWIPTEQVTPGALSVCDAIWCVPASPYRSMDGALAAIQFAREADIPFLGTCGGYQHAVLEYARNVLGYVDADNAEVNPDAKMPLISALQCKLVEKSDSVLLTPGSRAAELCKSKKIEEEYHCSYGVNPVYLPIFDTSDMIFTGFDMSGEPGVVELNCHKYFIGTAFQPERLSLKGAAHPLVVGLLNSVLESRPVD